MFELIVGAVCLNIAVAECVTGQCGLGADSMLQILQAQADTAPDSDYDFYDVKDDVAIIQDEDESDEDDKDEGIDEDLEDQDDDDPSCQAEGDGCDPDWPLECCDSLHCDTTQSFTHSDGGKVAGRCAGFGSLLQVKQQPTAGFRCVAGKAVDEKYGTKASMVASMYCTPGGSSRPVIIFVGSPKGSMGGWAKAISRTKAVGMNLNTWKVSDIVAAVEWCRNQANAPKFGFSTSKVVLSGYSMGGIASHEAWKSLMIQGKSPEGLLWMNGVTRGRTLDDPKGRTGEKAFVINRAVSGKILIIQGEKDAGFLAASEKYRQMLDETKVPYAWAPNGATHVNLMKYKDWIMAAVDRFLDNLKSNNASDWGAGQAPPEPAGAGVNKNAKDNNAYDPNTGLKGGKKKGGTKKGGTNKGGKGGK